MDECLLSSTKRHLLDGCARSEERCSQCGRRPLGLDRSERYRGDSQLVQGCGHGLRLRKTDAPRPAQRAGREALGQPLPNLQQPSAAYRGLLTGPWRKHFPYRAGPIRVGGGCRRSEARLIHARRRCQRSIGFACVNCTCAVHGRGIRGNRVAGLVPAGKTPPISARFAARTLSPWGCH